MIGSNLVKRVKSINLVKIVKSILLSSLCFIIIWVAFILVDGILLNPYAGGEIHRITWRPIELWKGAAFAVLAEYIVTLCVLVCLLILSKYPSHWSIIALEGAAIAAFECWHIGHFWTPGPDDNGWFVFGLMVLAFALVVGIAWLAHRLLMAYEGWYSQKP